MDIEDKVEITPSKTHITLSYTFRTSAISCSLHHQGPTSSLT